MFSKVTYALISGEKNFDGLVFIYQPLTPTLLMLDIYTS